MSEGKEKDNVAFHAKVYGLVQGVGFRYNTRREARRHGLTGWVRNEPDGTVEVLFEGDADSVRAFSNWLKKGPPGARVRNVEFKKVPYKGTFDSFSVAF
jgi:acylphosphatase